MYDPQLALIVKTVQESYCGAIFFDSISTCITYQQITGKQVDIEQFRDFPARFDREQVVNLTSIVSAYLEAWTGAIHVEGKESLVKEASCLKKVISYWRSGHEGTQ